MTETWSSFKFSSKHNSIWKMIQDTSYWFFFPDSRDFILALHFFNSRNYVQLWIQKTSYWSINFPDSRDIILVLLFFWFKRPHTVSSFILIIETLYWSEKCNIDFFWFRPHTGPLFFLIRETSYWSFSFLSSRKFLVVRKMHCRFSWSKISHSIPSFFLIQKTSYWQKNTWLILI